MSQAGQSLITLAFSPRRADRHDGQKSTNCLEFGKPDSHHGIGSRP
jgi:hypothetical protein